MAEETDETHDAPKLDPEVAKVLAWNERLVARGRRRFTVKVCAFFAAPPVLGVAVHRFFGSVSLSDAPGILLAVLLGIGMGIPVSRWLWKALERAIAEIRSGERIGRPRDLRESQAMVFIGQWLAYAAMVAVGFGPRQVFPFAIMFSIMGTVLATWGAAKTTRFYMRADPSVRRQKYAISAIPWYAAWVIVLTVAMFAGMAYHIAAFRLEHYWFPIWSAPKW